jgi:hypothetical protein
MIRLVRTEVRRGTLLPLLPVMAALLWLTPIAQHLQPVALWTDRSTDLQSAIQIVGPFTAAVAAWMASREHRHAMTGLLASTPRSPWRRWAVTWAATCGVAVAFYACLGTALFAITSAQATWGHPIVWPVLSGFTALIACSALGFAAGRLAPSRVTTPLTAIGVLAVMAAGPATAVRHWGLGVLSPMYPSISLNASVFYAVRPDLTYLQVGCYLGLTAAAFGLIVLRGHAGSRAVYRAGAGLAAAGLMTVAATFGLLSTSRHDSHGLVVPLLHDAASDRMIPYTPVCTQSSPLPVCLHPAYARANELAFFDTMVNTIAAPLAGVPGLPTRAAQSPNGDPGSVVAQVTGSPPVLGLPDDIVQGDSIGPAEFTATLRTRIALALVTREGTNPAVRSCRCAAATAITPAQQAAALYLLNQARYPAGPGLMSSDPAITAAARGLAALTAAARHTWFTGHIAALRAGTLTLEEMP